MADTRLQEIRRFRDAVGVPAVFAGTIGVGDEISFDVVGVRRRGSEEAAAADDRVHIGSCCKMITAVLFGTFVDEGRADWRMPITDLFPDLASSARAGWHQRTVEELFYCVGGVRANPPRRYLRSGFTDGRPLREQRTEIASLAFSRPPKKPGRFVYSNMGYLVLGAAIDRLAGGTFEDALAARVLRPLDIASAGYGPPPGIWGHGPRVVVGSLALFKGKPADPAKPQSDNPPMLSSAGTLHLNVNDWAKLLRLFLKHQAQNVIKDASVERILTLPETSPARMAMGWAPAALDGVGYGAQGSNLRWAATVLMDDARERIGFVACNDGRSRVLIKSPFLAHRLLTA